MTGRNGLWQAYDFTVTLDYRQSRSHSVTSELLLRSFVGPVKFLLFMTDLADRRRSTGKFMAYVCGSCGFQSLPHLFALRNALVSSGKIHSVEGDIFL